MKTYFMGFLSVQESSSCHSWRALQIGKICMPINGGLHYIDKILGPCMLTDHYKQADCFTE